ncbi:hypothetical protein B0H19DRAFT_1120164 [Mycena capillaripes]|nr:hypothetical protein B0H19DRAFT_1120164 [Mycena capillaripes]
MNPQGTLPTLEADGKVYTSTAEAVALFVKEASVKVKTGSAIIELIHEDKYDPNFAMLLARNEAELTANNNGFPGLYLSHRQAALERYSQGPGAEPYKAFYQVKLAQNGEMLAIISGRASEQDKAAYFAKSQAHFDSVKNAVFEIPGEDDFHVGAWLTRIAALNGAKSSDDAVVAMGAAFGKLVPGKVVAYWDVWTGKSSWKKVYANGLH